MCNARYRNALSPMELNQPEHGSTAMLWDKPGRLTILPDVSSPSDPRAAIRLRLTSICSFGNNTVQRLVGLSVRVVDLPNATGGPMRDYSLITRVRDMPPLLASLGQYATGDARGC
jgi:hypothetical protein